MNSVSRVLEKYAIKKDCLNNKEDLLYLNHTLKLSGVDIGNLIGVEKTTVRNAFVRLGLRLLRNGSKTKGKTKIVDSHAKSILNNKQSLIHLHHIKHKTIRDISKELGVSRKTVQNRFVHYNIEVLRFSEDIIKKRESTVLELHGVSNYARKHIPSDIVNLLGAKDWLVTQHHIHQKPLIIIASELGVSSKAVNLAFERHNIPKKRFCRSSGESELYNFLQDHVKDVNCNNRTLISPYELDIVIPSRKIAIEYCGLYWHSDKHKRIDKHYHVDKFNRCKNINFRLITIFEDEWIDKRKQVENKMRHLLHLDTSEIFYARACDIRHVSKKDKKIFFDNNHIQGNGRGSINLGLYYHDKLIACMSFIHQQKIHYLTRYATSSRVVGGFSKLLHKFKSVEDWKYLVSFADRRWSDGNLYEKTGWTLDSILPCDYSYVQHNKRVHKFNYRRKNLKKLLEHFDPKLSERENCDNAGLLRIWDCGKLRYMQTREDI